MMTASPGSRNLWLPNPSAIQHCAVAHGGAPSVAACSTLHPGSAQHAHGTETPIFPHSLCRWSQVCELSRVTFDSVWFGKLQTSVLSPPLPPWLFLKIQYTGKIKL